MNNTHNFSTRLLSSLILPVLLLTACNEKTLPKSVIRPAQVWSLQDQGVINHSRQYSGEIVARHETNLSFRVSGKIIQRLVDVGDTVKKGQTLAKLDNSDQQLTASNVSANLLAAQGSLQSSQSSFRAAQSQQDSARASLRAAQAELTNAQEEFQRTRKLHSQNYLSKAALDAETNRLQTAQANVRAAQAQVQTAGANAGASQAQIKSAQAQVAALQSQVALANNQTRYTNLSSTVSGVVTSISVEEGQVVSPGMTVLRIAEVGEREVQIRVGEDIIQQLQTNTSAAVSFWANPDQQLQGFVREIAPAADRNRTWLVKISLPDAPADLSLGLTANVNFSLQETTPGSWLPSTALFQQEGETAVWTLSPENQAQLQSIEVLQYQDDGMIVSGLSTGSQVIVAGVHTLHQGQKLRPIPYNGQARPGGIGSQASSQNINPANARDRTTETANSDPIPPELLQVNN